MRSLTLESATSPSVSLSWLRPWLSAKVLAGGAIVLTLIFVGILAPVLAPYDPNAQQLRAMVQEPQWFGGIHFLGTDNLGRDVLSRIIYGARVSLLVALAVVAVSGFVGISLGAISGYFGGKVDFTIQKSVEVVWAFPPLLLAIAIMAFLGQGLFNLILALVAQRWIQYCRVVRAQTLSLRNRDFVTATRALGARDNVIIRRHILPNLIQISLVIGTFAMASAIISESDLPAGSMPFFSKNSISALTLGRLPLCAYTQYCPHSSRWNGWVFSSDTTPCVALRMCAMTLSERIG